MNFSKSNYIIAMIKNINYWVKKNPYSMIIISLLFGYIIGQNRIFGGGTDSAGNENPSQNHIMQTAISKFPPKISNFDLISYDPYGDVFITVSGKKYHRSGCSSLRRSKEILQVNSQEAEEIGISPCSRCM